MISASVLHALSFFPRAIWLQRLILRVIDSEGTLRKRLDEDIKSEIQAALIYAVKNGRELI